MDLRSFIDVLSKQGRLRRIEREVDWRFEIGAITRENQQPLLFEKVKGYPRARVFTNGLSGVELIELALGLDHSHNRKQIIEEIKKRAKNPLAPKIVATGPVLENVVPSSDIDLFQFPVPQWSTEDACRYIGT